MVLIYLVFINNVYYLNVSYKNRPMSVSVRRLRQIKEMKKTILDAASTLFYKNGYEETTLRKIAQLIDYNPATIYNYYKNKEEIFFALQERAFQKFYEEFDFYRTTKMKGRKCLRRMGKAYIKFGIEHKQDYELMFIMREPMNGAEIIDPKWKIGAKNYELLKLVIGQCIEEESIRITDINVGAFMIWSAVHGMVSLYIMDRMKMINDIKHDQLIEKAFQQFDELLNTI